MRVFASVWWPRVSQAIEDFVQSCPVCEKTVMLPREPLVSLSLPSYPWERILVRAERLNLPFGSRLLLKIRGGTKAIYNHFFKCSNSVEEYFCKIWNSPYHDNG